LKNPARVKHTSRYLAFCIGKFGGLVVGVARAAFYEGIIPLIAIFFWISQYKMFFRRKYPERENDRWFD